MVMSDLPDAVREVLEMIVGKVGPHEWNADRTDWRCELDNEHLAKMNLWLSYREIQAIADYLNFDLFPGRQPPEALEEKPTAWGTW